VPPGSKIVGESYSVIMGAGTFFTNISAPKPIVMVGNAGETGVVEWSDMIVSTQGALKGAILIQWNLASSPTTPSGMWDVHTRIGGFAGSNLLLKDCASTTAAVTAVDQDCIAAWMSLHLSKTSQGLYMENVWGWVADHDVEDATLRRVTIYAGRGLYSESTKGSFWLVGTSFEHHTFYQYQFANTPNVYMGQIQTETAYYQPNPKASTPFPIVAGWNDPPFKAACNAVTGNCEDGWGLRIVNSTNIYVYGAGLYSFFNNYATSKCIYWKMLIILQLTQNRML
jgi:glucan 1,3-beta-glucosidase